VVIAVLSLILAPWAHQQSESYRQSMDQRDDVARVSPGAFNESSGADRVFFVESVAGQDGRVKNVFISSIQQGRLGVMATAEGHTETQSQRRPLSGSRSRAALRGHGGHRRVSGDGVRSLFGADRNQGGARP
jgi:lipopolysaccharide export LptBFGC system permease protein LptF